MEQLGKKVGKPQTAQVRGHLHIHVTQPACIPSDRHTYTHAHTHTSQHALTPMCTHKSCVHACHACMHSGENRLCRCC